MLGNSKLKVRPSQYAAKELNYVPLFVEMKMLGERQLYNSLLRWVAETLNQGVRRNIRSVYDGLKEIKGKNKRREEIENKKKEKRETPISIMTYYLASRVSNSNYISSESI